MVEPALLITVEEAAALLGLKRSYFWEHLLGTEFCIVKLGRATRVSRAAVLAYAVRLIEEASEPTAATPAVDARVQH